MDGEQLIQGWNQVSDEVARELACWRAEHSRATLAEIEQVVQEALSRLQARYLTDLSHASDAADLTRSAADERPCCPGCGGALKPSGRAERQVLTPRQATPLRLERSYGVCSACGSEAFSPWMRNWSCCP